MGEISDSFLQFQSELDAQHDKYERLVKLSRDITISSKRAIFQIHRINSADDWKQAVLEVETKLQELVHTKWLQIAKELVTEDPYKFLRAFSPGLQEYIEAVALCHYISHCSLISHSQVQEQLSFADDKTSPPHGVSKNALVVHVPLSEYLLGVADCSGELMRIAVHGMSHGDARAPRDISSFLRDLNSALSLLPPTGRDMQQKMTTMKQNVAKVEAACYTLHVRGSELPQHLLADILASQPHVVEFESTD